MRQTFIVLLGIRTNSAVQTGSGPKLVCKDPFEMLAKFNLNF